MKARVSWPEVGTTPVDVMPLLPPDEQARLAGWRHRLLRDPEDQQREREACSIAEPFMDSILRSQPRAYHGFLAELLSRGLISLERTDDAAYTVGCFFVIKKSGALRLVFGTRLANTQFITPPKTALPSAAAFAAVEVEAASGGGRCYMGSADMSNAFYNMRLPESMWSCFTLPPISEAALPVALRAAVPPGAGRLLRPALRVLPMGWTWALDLCQTVVEGITAQALGHDSLIHDKEESRILAERARPASSSEGQAADISCATYVDNVCVMATSYDRAAAGLLRAVMALRERGLPVHEINDPAENQEFIGLELVAGRLRVKPRRLWKLRYGIHEVLRRGRISGPALEVLLGHLVRHMMTVRPALAVFDAVYEHVRAHRATAGVLSIGARRELSQACALLPLMVADMFAPWETSVMCFDASPIAYAVCETRRSVGEVRALGRTAERWRSKSAEHMKGRQAALALPEPDALRSDSDRGPASFEEVPRNVLDPSDYVHLFTGRIRRDERITRSEARGLSWGVRHRLRDKASLGRRLLLLGDNMTLTLAVGKGRSGSPLLRGTLRELAAITLATGTRLVSRWIPSEHNVADGPSRLRPMHPASAELEPEGARPNSQAHAPARLVQPAPETPCRPHPAARGRDPGHAIHREQLPPPGLDDRGDHCFSPGAGAEAARPR